MEVRMLDKSKDGLKLSFLVKGADTVYANTLRRSIVNEVPTMAIEDIEFKKNSSILYDELLAHRLGLVPLKTDLKSYTLPEECSCKGNGCSQCQLKLTLKGKGPKTLYASGIKSKDPKVKPIYPKMPIVKLLDGQEVDLTATAVLGKGKVHIKWSPGLCYYRQKPIIKVNNKSPKIKEYKDKFPKAIFKGETIDKNLIIDNDLVGAVEGVCEDVIKVEYEKDSYIFKIESWGQLDAKDVVKAAVSTFDDKLKEFEKVLKKA